MEKNILIYSRDHKPILIKEDPRKKQMEQQGYGPFWYLSPYYSFDKGATWKRSDYRCMWHLAIDMRDYTMSELVELLNDNK